MTLLTKSDCEQQRSPQELKLWVASVFEKFGTSDDTKNYMRTKKGLTKPFVEEIVPLSTIADHKYRGRSDVVLKPKFGNQAYDAEIVIGDQKAHQTIKVEIGNAIDGQDDILRMEYLIQHGHVYLSGGASRTGTKASGGQVTVENACERHEEALEKRLVLIQELIQHKLVKQYESGTLLVIVFDDYLPFDQAKDSPAVEAALSPAVLNEVLAKFSGLTLVGQSGRYFKEYALP